MTQPFRDFPELKALIDALCEEAIAPEQLRRLEELVLANPEAEAYYVQAMSLYAGLHRHFAALPARTEQSLRNRAVATPAPRPKHQRFRFLLGGAIGLAGLAAGMLLAVGLAPYWLPPATTPYTEPVTEIEDNTVAVLIQAHGATWLDTGLPTRPGAALPPGWLNLQSGYAQIQFYSGATVILEGPAEFQLISRMEAYCSRGKLRATVPPQAEGFAIGSPKFNLVDRGTEFGLQIGADRTEVHVILGKVELFDPKKTPSGTPARELTTGQGVRLDEVAGLSPIASNPTGFKSASDLAEQSTQQFRLHHKEWTKKSQALAQDPNLVLYYSFQPKQVDSGMLLDRAQDRKQPNDGVIVGCSWETGRWPGKQGLVFKRVSDRVRFHVPGEFESIALAAWVRVDALPHRFNALFLTDDWLEGAPHWHISDKGRLELGVQGPKPVGGVHYLSPEVITPNRFGDWIHLAVVYDRNAYAVTHYVDGEMVHREHLLVDTPLKLGDTEIGNWNPGTRRDKSSVRYFNGCIDEFMLFSRALSEQEIQKLYLQGRPPL